MLHKFRVLSSPDRSWDVSFWHAAVYDVIRFCGIFPARLSESMNCMRWSGESGRCLGARRAGRNLRKIPSCSQTFKPLYRTIKESSTLNLTCLWSRGIERCLLPKRNSEVCQSQKTSVLLSQLRLQPDFVHQPPPMTSRRPSECSVPLKKGKTIF